MTAFTGLVKATGGDVDKVSVLVNELREKPELIQEIEDRQTVRKRIAANKAIGELIETLLRARLTDAGLRVTRTGVGSDYEVMNDVVDEDGEAWFAIGDASVRVLVEVKATTVDSVRMTRQQAQTAERERNRFALCVVELPEDGNPDAAHVEATARFVVNIGSTLAPLCAALDSVESFRSRAPLVAGALEVILTEGPVRFKVGASLWRDERTLQEFVDYVTNQA